VHGDAAGLVQQACSWTLQQGMSHCLRLLGFVPGKIGAQLLLLAVACELDMLPFGADRKSVLAQFGSAALLLLCAAQLAACAFAHITSKFFGVCSTCHVVISLVLLLRESGCCASIWCGLVLGSSISVVLVQAVIVAASKQYQWVLLGSPQVAVPAVALLLCVSCSHVWF
jgi:hypothetical protein